MGCLLSKPIEDNLRPLSETLPDDIMIDILSRLSDKYLLRSRPVSRSWLKLIDMHYDRRSKDQFILRDKNHNLYTFEYHENKHRLEEIDEPKCRKIWGSCDGLVCMQSDLGICIWNPSTNQYREVRCMEETSSRFAAYGFYYNREVNDYEVVCIKYMGPGICLSKVFVYSLRKESESWRRVADTPYRTFPRLGEVVNGCLHWFAADTPYRTFPRLGEVVNGCLHWFAVGGSPVSSTVIAFESKDGVFVEIQSPNSLTPCYCNTSIGEIQGKLSMLHTDTTFQVWVMNEYGVRDSWTKLFTIAKPITTRCWSIHKFLLCSTKKGLILMRGEDNNLILYDPIYSHCQEIQGIPELEQVVYNYVERSDEHKIVRR